MTSAESVTSVSTCLTMPCDSRRMSRISLSAAVPMTILPGHRSVLFPRSQAPAGFTIRTERVLVDVSVTSGDEPVSNLGIADFRVFDDGIEQVATLLASDEQEAGLVLVLDMSSSVLSSLDAVRATSTAVTQRLNERDAVALIGFNERIQRIVPWTSDFRAATSALDIARGGDSSLFDALCAGLALASDFPGRASVLVVTDGLDTSSFLSFAALRESARRSNAALHAVVTGKSATPDLDSLVDFSGGERLSAASNDLPLRIEQLLNYLRQRYVLAFSPSERAAVGWHSLRVEVPTRRVRIRARPGYFRR